MAAATVVFSRAEMRRPSPGTSRFTGPLVRRCDRLEIKLAKLRGELFGVRGARREAAQRFKRIRQTHTDGRHHPEQCPAVACAGIPEAVHRAVRDEGERSGWCVRLLLTD